MLRWIYFPTTLTWFYNQTYTFMFLSLCSTASALGFEKTFHFDKTFSIKFSPSNLNFKAGLSLLYFLNLPQVTPSVTAAIVLSAKNEKLFPLIIKVWTTYKINAIHNSSHKLSGLRTFRSFWVPKSSITIIPHATLMSFFRTPFTYFSSASRQSACRLSGG